MTRSFVDRVRHCLAQSGTIVSIRVNSLRYEVRENLGAFIVAWPSVLAKEFDEAVSQSNPAKRMLR